MSEDKRVEILEVVGKSGRLGCKFVLDEDAKQIELECKAEGEGRVDLDDMTLELLGKIHKLVEEKKKEDGQP